MKKSSLRIIYTAGLIAGSKYIAHGQTFTDLDSESNPLLNIKVVEFSTPVFVDIDDDGDLDLVSGDVNGLIYTFENKAGSFEPSSTNAFSLINVYGESFPAFADIDEDGDMDLVVGNYNGLLSFFINDVGIFSPADDNPFEGIDLGFNTVPTFVDIDGDGDMDLVVGEYYGIHTFINESGEFTQAANNPFQNIDFSYNLVPTFIDIDDDGDMDMVVGERYGALKTYLNNNGVFTAAVADPFAEVNLGERAVPSFYDIDGDGDMDFIGGSAYGDFTLLFQRDGKFESDSKSPLVDFQVLYNSAPTFVDFDGDGDMDMVSGDVEGRFHLYERKDDNFTAVNSVLDQLRVSYTSSPVFVDLDEDGDMDLVSGNAYGVIDVFLRQGDNFAIAPANPFASIDVGYAAAPTFIDLDEDGDMDLVLGGIEGKLVAYANDGGAFNPIIPNPFDGIEINDFSSPTFVDLDEDKDLDLVIGSEEGPLVSYMNESGVFVPATEDYFGAFQLKHDLKPAFADIDGDGDMDGVVGNTKGRFRVLRNNTVSSVKTTLNEYVEKLLVYPNPAQDKLFFDVTNIGQVSIYNQMGQLVKNEQLNGSNFVQVQDLVCGLYILEITQGNQLGRTLFVKK